MSEAVIIPPGIVEVSETLTGRFANEVRVGRHSIIADEPVDAGGNDTGPMPHDFVLAGLGACTAMTVRMYAERKGIPLKRISVRLSYRKMKAADCPDCVTKDGEITEMTRDVTLEGDLTDEQRQRLIEIANKCPVHKTLTGEIKVRTHLVS
jgi:putative redox protein